MKSRSPWLVLHGGHGPKLELAAEEVEVRRPLEDVPRIEEQDVLVGLAHAPDQRRPPGRSAQSLEAPAVHGEGVHPRVRVVGVQHDQADAVVV